MPNSSSEVLFFVLSSGFWLIAGFVMGRIYNRIGEGK